MKNAIWLVLVLFFYLVSKASDNRMMIVQNGKIGYINNRGNIVIPAIYDNGMNFSEGMAAVRKNGYFGFIDTNGKLVVPFQYEYAWNFSHGLARVGDVKNIRYINKHNVEILNHINGSLLFFGAQKALYRTNGKHAGVIDMTTGQLLIDTIFTSIDTFSKGVALATIVKELNNEERVTSYCVLDTNGKIIVPFGAYDEIEPFSDGYAIVKTEDSNRKDKETAGVIDSRGHLIFNMKPANNQFLYGKFHDGLAVISLYKNWLPEKEGYIFSSDKSYNGYMNTNGQIVLNDTNIKYAENFSCNRAIIRDDYYSYIVNTQMQRVGSRFSHIENFKNGFAIATNAAGTGIIDTNGQFIVPPSKLDIVAMTRDNKYLVIKVDTDDDHNEHYGLMNMKNKIIIPPVTNGILTVNNDDGIIIAVMNNKVVYFDFTGKRIWEMDENDKNNMRNADLDYKVRGYFYVSNDQLENQNDYKATNLQLSNFKKQKFTLYLDTMHTDTLENVHWGYHVYLANDTKDTAYFDDQDHRLYIKAQATDENGNWQDIEYLPNSWCGNSYGNIPLYPGKYWSFLMPKYTGIIKTRIRLKLYNYRFAGDRTDQAKVIYSNEINGAVNPAQFWNKRLYQPQGLMDPYDE